MQSDVDKICGNRFAIREATGSVGDAQGDVMAGKQPQQPLVDPAGVADLKGVAEPGVERVHKSSCCRFVKRQARRQLQQDRTEFVPQQGGAGIQPGERLSAIVQPFGVSDGAAGLEVKAEPVRGALVPALVGPVTRTAVKGCVKLDGAEVAAVVFQPLFLRQIPLQSWPVWQQKDFSLWGLWGRVHPTRQRRYRPWLSRRLFSLLIFHFS